MSLLAQLLNENLKLAVDPDLDVRRLGKLINVIQDQRVIKVLISLDFNGKFCRVGY